MNVAKRYKVGKQSNNILEEIEALERWKSKFKFTKAEIPLVEVASTSIGPSTSTPDANFDLQALSVYTVKNSGKKMNATSKAQISEIEMDDYISNVTYPSYLPHTCHVLQHL
ncbi:hypothetical protein L1987_68760 [Smallanthus sonchifolius]|uniref:Uncharacterized protein n=1 Tax=Smallanthus sonchifolius TaxID=185202 RepID=A0ACB9B4B3_9ASTR|nr:hypothetical protein L1987_68760 [Smallanthus sonchifolius]